MLHHSFFPPQPLWRGAALYLFAWLPSCGVAPRTDFPNRLFGAEGQEFVLEDLEAIAHDVRLSDDEKRQAFRDLGMEDEELIAALLNL